MKFVPHQPPRTFEVDAPENRGGPVTMTDCGHISLAPNEQVTLLTEAGAEYDVARKSWGFYATPSLNSRLARFGLRAVLMKCPEEGNATPKNFVYFVERGHESGFQAYINERGYEVVCWMDSTETLKQIERVTIGEDP